ncbi:MAG: PAS domain S-box protein [bacterium]
MMKREEEKLLKQLKEDNKRLRQENLHLKKIVEHPLGNEEKNEELKDRNGIFLRILTDAIKDVDHAFVLTDENGLVKYVNNSFEKMTGFSFLETKDKNPREFIKSGLNPDSIYEDLWRTIENGEKWSGVLINKRKDGALYHEEISITPFTEPVSQKKYFAALKTDVTTKVLLDQEISQSEKRFKGLVYNVEGISVQGYYKDGTVFFWNKASEILYGYTEQEALGKNMLDLIIPSEMKEQVKLRLKSIENKRSDFPSSEELFLKDKFGRPIHVFSNHTLLINQNHEPEFFCIDIDLREKDEAEAVIITETNKSKWIAQLGFDLIKCNTIDECLHVMINTLHAVMPQTILAVTRFLPDQDHVQLFDVKGLGHDLLVKALKILGVDLKSKIFTRFPDSYFEPMKLKKLNMGFGWILKEAGFASTTVNKILKIIKVFDNYTINIAAKEHLFGNISIFTHRPDYQPDSQFIESVVYQTAMAISQIEAYQNLQKNEFRFRSILDILPQLISHVDKNLVYDYANKTYEKKFDIQPGDLIGKPLREVIGEKAFYKAHKHIYKVLGGERVKYLEKLHYKNGQELFIEGTLIPDNYNGKTEGYYGVLTDVTEYVKSREDLKKSEEQYRLIFDNSPLGIFHLDAEGMFVKVNKGFADITGLKGDDVIGKSGFSIGLKPIHKYEEKVFNGEPTSFDLNYQRPESDKSKPVRILLSPVLSGHRIEGIIGMIEDRSNYVEKQELEKKVAVAEESARFKQNFLANMSHEIRTPLTGILGMIDIMENKDCSENYQEYISILKQSGNNLREIINQVLDFSKIEAGRTVLHKNAFSFGGLIQKSEHLFENICKKTIAYHSIVDPTIPELIVADQYRITQIINNYLSNAVKFTEKGSITLKAELISDGKHGNPLKIKISVTDTGMGIEPEIQHLLFQPFSQIDKYDRRPIEGTGLGLSICKEIAQLHGGETGVESEKGVGSTFWFTFLAEVYDPADMKNGVSILNPTPSDFVQNERLSVNNTRKLKILFAEDKIVNQKVVTIMLQSLGHEVFIAQNGEETLKVFPTRKFDLILMDIQMPVMDGIEATRKLKEKFTDIPPLVGLSANAFEGDREKYMYLGMDEYITKPVKRDDFLNLIKKLKI